ncbi:peptide/nickel transport system permease protein [Micromonospora inyonensis]|uniref:Peptide/nickel transport system permease protein n=2 Tax=Micromonospora inyonensis TaxID=47866 RepID=A0A1C6RE27_9ACTN|nr:peptide/nickel transport system permease protein [Micromonospora inyonensis]
MRLRWDMVTPVAALAVVALALLGRHLAPNDPEQPVAVPWSAPSTRLPLGADALGRDVLSRVVAGGANLLGVALTAAAAALLIGVAFGLLAGWWPARAGRVVRWLGDLLLAVPALILALVLAVALPGATAVVVASVVSGAPLTARVVAGQCGTIRGSGYLHAAVERGERGPVILVRELLPALSGLVAADAGLRLITALQLATTLAVLGFGPQPPDADWALMLSENLPGVALNPAALLAPAVPLALCALLFAAAARAAGRRLEGVA